MTFNDFMQQVLALFPNAEVWESSVGELTISTGLVATGDEDGTLIDWEDRDLDEIHDLLKPMGNL